MRAQLSVVIPTLNAARVLPACLAALMEGLERGLIRDLVITDGGSGDETLQIADAVGAVIVSGGASRGGQLRRGAMAAGGEWLLFLHADTVLPRGWAEVVEGQIARGRPACFRLGFDARGLMPVLVAAWANLRTGLLHLPYGDQGLLVSRAEYEMVGGYPDIPLMEDVAMARRLGARTEVMPLRLRSSAVRYQQGGWLRQGARNLWRLLRYLCGADPERLARRY